RVSEAGVGTRSVASSAGEQRSTWRFAGTLPQGLAYASAAVLGDRVFLMGGLDTGVAWLSLTLRVRPDRMIEEARLLPLSSGLAAFSTLSRTSDEAVVF